MKGASMPTPGQLVARRVSRVALRARQNGFTIVETMIVLAVTAAIFLMAVLTVGGQQNKAEFTQAIHDIQSNIQDTINDVGAGSYADTGNFTCDGTSGSLNIQQGSGNQGASTGCIFLGKALEFGVSSTDPQQFITYTIAGLQNNDGSLSSAAPQAIAPGNTTNNSANYPDASIKSALHNGLTAVSMDYISGGTKTSIGAVAFISSLGQYNSDASLISGSQQISLMPVSGTGNAGKLNTSPTGTVDAINKNLETSPVNPDGGVEICFASGTTDQSGLLTIGSNGRNLSVQLAIKSGRSC